MPEKTRQQFDRVYAAWQTAAWKAGRSWCGLMHNSPMWPIHGQYQCGDCGRRYSVPWAVETFEPAEMSLTNVEPEQIRPEGVPSYVARPHGLRAVALLPRVILLAILLAPHIQAAEPLIVDSTAQAAMAFARYTVGLQQATPWSLETVEIEAARPKLEKHARLRAIRRLLPHGKPEYQVLEVA